MAKLPLSKAAFIEKAAAFMINYPLTWTTKSKISIHLNRNSMNCTRNLVKNHLRESSVIYQRIRVKKKFQTRFGQIEIADAHTYSDAILGYRISSYLQERLVFAGQSDVYGSCNVLISKFLRIDINAMQVHRLTNTYGELSAGLVDESDSQALVSTLKDDEVVYVQADGSMVLTREDKWQEVKVGRIFKQSAITSLRDAPRNPTIVICCSFRRL